MDDIFSREPATNYQKGIQCFLKLLSVTHFNDTRFQSTDSTDEFPLEFP